MPNERDRPTKGGPNVSERAVQTGYILPPAAPVEPLTEAEARSLTGQIRSLAEAIADRVDLLVDKIQQARDGQAHIALNYKSWPDYIQTEFAGVLPRLEREPRRELVAALTETGLSSRAIAPIAKVSDRQVRADVASGGKRLPTSMVDATEQARAEQKVTTIPTNNVIGIDGRNYPRPEPRKERRPSRSPLPDSYGSAVFRLEKAVGSLQRLHDDDRFLRSRVELKERNSRTISNAWALLQSIESDLDGHQCRDCDGRVGVNSEFYSECEACR